MEEKAYSGYLPWVECTDDSSNSAEDLGIPRKLILSPILRVAFKETFEAGKQEPRRRPSLYDLSKVFLNAAEATLKCPKCKGTFFFKLEACPWCKSGRPVF